MAGEKYIPSGVWLTCDKGAIPSQFTSTPKTIKLYGKFFATEADLIPMVNIQPFGVCSVDGVSVYANTCAVVRCARWWLKSFRI
jgi:hypothetical protein